MLLHKAWTLAAHRMHAASILLHRACDYEVPNIAYGCTEFAITVHKASISSILLNMLDMEALCS